MHLNKLISCCFGILFLSFSFGQDTSKTLAPIPIFAKSDSIARIAIITSSIPHFELSADKMDELGAADVGEALKYIPGIQLRDYGGIGGVKTISFRSLGAAYTGVQIDGTHIPAVQSGVINLSNFELFGLEKVSFTAGQVLDNESTASAYLQANTIALKSVLNSKPNNWRAGVYSNLTSINAYEMGAYIQKSLGNRFFVGGQGMVRFGNGQYKYILPNQSLIVQETRTNTAQTNYRMRLVAGFNGKRHKIRLAGFYNDNEQELPGATVFYNPSNDQKLWNTDWRLGLKHAFSKGKWKLNSQANFQANNTRYYDPYYLNLQGFIDANYLQQNGTAGFMLARHFRFPKERIFLGADVRYSTLNGNNSNSKPKRIQENIVLGAATMFYRFRIDGNLSAQIITDQFEQGQSNKFFKLSPFLAVAYLPFKNKAFRIRGFYKNTFRMPTFNDLYYNFIGNANLLPEEANSYNLGLTYGHSGKKITVEFTGDLYYNEVKNKIVAIPTKNLFNWSMQNIGEVEIHGVDIGTLLSFNIKQIAINLNTNHAFNTSVDITNSNSITFGQQIPYTPYYTNSNGLNIGWKGFKISSNVLYSGFRYSLNENNNANYMSPFTDLNVGLSKNFKMKASNFLVDFKVMNLLNKNYQIIRSFPMPGRHLQLRLKYNLEK